MAGKRAGHGVPRGNDFVLGPIPAPGLQELDPSMLTAVLGSEYTGVPEGDFNQRLEQARGEPSKIMGLVTKYLKQIEDGQYGQLFPLGIVGFSDKLVSPEVRMAWGDMLSGRRVKAEFGRERNLEYFDVIVAPKTRVQFHKLLVGGGVVARTLAALGKKQPSRVRAFFCQAFGDPRAALHVTQDPTTKDLDFIMRTFSRVTSVQVRKSRDEVRHETFDGATFGRLRFGITRWSVQNVRDRVGSHPSGIQGMGINLGLFTLWLPTLKGGKNHKLAGRTVGLPLHPIAWLRGLWKNRKDIVALGTSRRWEQLRPMPRTSLRGANRGASSTRASGGNRGWAPRRTPALAGAGL